MGILAGCSIEGSIERVQAPSTAEPPARVELVSGAGVFSTASNGDKVSLTIGEVFQAESETESGYKAKVTLSRAMGSE
jgi:hypothetical protein